MSYALVVDDDSTCRMYVTAALRKSGYEVIEAADGIEGLARYYERPYGFYSVIVSDYSMPRLTGTKMVHRILDKDEGQKVVMMSSEPLIVRKELADFGIDDVIVLDKSADDFLQSIK